MSIRIIVDSTADMPAQVRQELDIQMLPLKVRFGEEEFADGVTITNPEFYAKLRQSKDLPVTSQVNPGEFQKAYEEAGEDDVIVITLAGKLSGTCQSAMMAKEQLGKENVYVVDSCNAAVGASLLAREAVRLRAEGMPAQQIFAALESLKSRLTLLLAVDTLTYLVKGGRLSPVAGAMGGLLSIKPVLHIDRTGALAVLNKTRGFKNACTWMLEEMDRRGVDTRYPIGVCHADNLQWCQQLADALGTKYSQNTVFLQELGAVLGTHTGPDALAIAFIDQE